MYSPGSTFKMLVLLAALEKGVINPDQKISCNGEYELGDAKFHCWKRHGHGPMNAVDAIAQSCDVYFYEIAKRTGIDRIAAMSRKFGFDSPTGVDLPGERGGLMPTRDWKRMKHDEPWVQGETVISGIGQGFILATPLQLALMTSRIANGGLAVVPHLTRAVGGNPTPMVTPDSQNSLNIPPRHLELIKRSMDEVVNGERGTARRSATKVDGFDMAGKTGTVQVRRITKAEREAGVRKNEDLPWRFRDHALFVGYAPVENPRYAVAVVVEHGGGGSSVAAPIARDVLVEAHRRGSAGPGALIASPPSVGPVQESKDTAPDASPARTVTADGGQGT
jgi:penicillin-binding protein 2